MTMLSEYENNEYHEVYDCPVCVGGMVTCPFCFGEDLDTKPCYECNSTGQVSCSNCDGTGYIVPKSTKGRR